MGREHLRINYLADNYILSFYHDIPFEDGSGTDFRSFPDGTYCFYYGSKNPEQWISDVIYEFYYTKYQSGSRHDRPATEEEKKKQDPKSHFYGEKYSGDATTISTTVNMPTAGRYTGRLSAARS